MPKNPKSRDSYSLCIFFTIHNRLPALTTPLLSNTSCSRSCSLSLPSHSSSSWTTTLPLPLLDDPQFISFHPSSVPFLNASPHKFKTLRRASEGFNGYYCVWFCQREEWQNEYMRFYGALEWQIQDQIQHKHFGDHIFRLHRETARRDTLEWTTKNMSYTLTEKFCLYLVAPFGRWWSLGRGADGEELKGQVHHWKVEPVGYIYLHR